MSHLVASLALAAACILWFLVQRALTDAGGRGRELAGGCGGCDRADECAARADDPCGEGS